MAMQQIREIVDILREDSDLPAAFDENLYLSLVDHMVAESDTQLRFCLNGGIEVVQQVEVGV